MGTHHDGRHHRCLGGPGRRLGRLPRLDVPRQQHQDLGEVQHRVGDRAVSEGLDKALDQLLRAQPESDEEGGSLPRYIPLGLLVVPPEELPSQQPDNQDLQRYLRRLLAHYRPATKAKAKDKDSADR